jgi:hypothetical protein
MAVAIVGAIKENNKKMNNPPLQSYEYIERWFHKCFVLPPPSTRSRAGQRRQRRRQLLFRSQEELVICRRQFLHAFINVVLQRQGYPLWTTFDPCYRLHFLRHVLGETDQQIARGRPFYFQLRPSLTRE